MRKHSVGGFLPVAVGVTVCLVSFIATISYLKKRQNEKKATARRRGPCPKGFPEQLWHALHVAADRIRENRSLRNGDRLLLYALYKQATVGSAPPSFGSPSSWNIVVEKAKYDAWCRMRGMTQQEAALHYIQAAAELENEEGEQVEDDSQGLGAPAVSRPAVVDNGGYAEEDDGNSSPEASLLVAAGGNDIDRLKELLESGVNVDHADESGQTAMHLAADKGSVEALSLLLEHGGNPNGADHDGISVLQTAVIAGHVDVVQLLLSKGSNPDQEDTDGDTPRSCAAEDGSPEMKQLFK